jgi:RimJ/RimL family protein N-acetyltransferase
MHIHLETERLILRRFTPDDVDLLVELDADPEVMRYLSGGPATPSELIEREILPSVLRSYDRPGYGSWAAIEKDSGDFLGWISFRSRDDATHGEATLGYRLHRMAWGRGYATEGARALIRIGFEQLGIRRVLATTYEENHASRRVMEKLGMTLVRSFRLTPADLAATGTFDSTAQEPWDGEDVEYAITKEDWERQQAGER